MAEFQKRYAHTEHMKEFGESCSSGYEITHTLGEGDKLPCHVRVIIDLSTSVAAISQELYYYVYTIYGHCCSSLYLLLCVCRLVRALRRLWILNTQQR